MRHYRRFALWLGLAGALPAMLGACSSSTALPVLTPTADSSIRTDIALEDQFIAVVNKVSPAVVAIETDSGLGSGVILDQKGNLVTNAHVVAGSTSFRVFLSTGKSFPATLVGSFVQDDIAVLRIDAPNLTPAVFGDSDHLRAGSIVMAIGSPLGLQGSVTEGIVSAIGRQVSEPNGVALPPLIQTSAAINPGNSGGALVDLDAQVVGITTLAAQDPLAGGTAPGLGFAIPSNIVTDIAAQLIQSGRVTNSHRAYLGVQVGSLAGGQGALIYSVVAAGPAERAGLKANDIITAIGDHAVVDEASLASVLSALQPGQSVTVKVIRSDGSAGEVAIVLGELPG
ncbi:MAG TPA: trypsin-like peptidase domain-containing protein [Patescibacteria group bacterium]|nr:trypsin-like peptidase domain-containing protein [Patescibacteria group bacterium]